MRLMGLRSWARLAPHRSSSTPTRELKPLLTEEMREHWPPDRVKECDDAINEYFAIERLPSNLIGEAAGGEHLDPPNYWPLSSRAKTWHR